MCLLLRLKLRFCRCHLASKSLARGKSISIDEQKPFASGAECKYLERTRMVQSITISYQAIEAILGYTHNLENQAVKRYILSLVNHRDKTGGYGAYGEIISAYHTASTRILSKARHTATALLSYLCSLQKEDLHKFSHLIIPSVGFIVESANTDGGWGLPGEDSDSASTLYVMQLLTYICHSEIAKMLTKEYSERIDQAILTGMKWLRVRNQEGGGYWHFINGISNFSDTAEVLTFFNNMSHYDDRLFSDSLERLSKLQRSSDGGFPNFLNGNSDLRATIWVTNALGFSHSKKFEKTLENSFDFVLQNITDPAHSTTLSSEHWALILRLSSCKGIQLTTHREYELSTLAEQVLNQVFEKGNLNFLEQGLPREFAYLRETIQKALKNCNPELESRKSRDTSTASIYCEEIITQDAGRSQTQIAILTFNQAERRAVTEYFSMTAVPGTHYQIRKPNGAKHLVACCMGSQSFDGGRYDIEEPEKSELPFVMFSEFIIPHVTEKYGTMLDTSIIPPSKTLRDLASNIAFEEKWKSKCPVRRTCVRN